MAAPSGHSASYVFVSYSRRDIAAVRKIIRALEKESFQTWFDQNAIIGGQTFDDEIFRAIDNCSALILMKSPSAIASEWTKKEWSRAQDKNKPIIPVLISPIDSAMDPLPRLHWIDFSDLSNGDQIAFSLYHLVKAICEHANIPNCQAAVESVRKKTGSERIASLLDEIRGNVVSTEQWLTNVDESCTEAAGEWQPSDQSTTTGRLVALALGEDVRDPQIMAHAAQTIARCGNLSAVEALTARLRESDRKDRIFNAFFQIWSSRRDGLPWRDLGGARLPIRASIARRQLAEKPLLPHFLAAFCGAFVAFALSFYAGFGGSEKVFPWSRIDYALSSTIYALLISVAIALVSTVSPRLSVFGPLRFAVGFIFAWMIVASAFIGLNMFSLSRHPFDSFSVLPLSGLFIFGYVCSGFVPVNQPWQSFLRIIIAFIGVFFALYLPCNWSLVHARLFYFDESACQLYALLFAVILATLPFAYEVWVQLSERGGVLHRVLGRIGRQR